MRFRSGYRLPQWYPSLAQVTTTCIDTTDKPYRLNALRAEKAVDLGFFQWNLPESRRRNTRCRSHPFSRSAFGPAAKKELVPPECDTVDAKRLERFGCGLCGVWVIVRRELVMHSQVLWK
jgi:hypothetical protein